MFEECKKRGKILKKAECCCAKKYKGAFTLEATIVMSSVLVILFAVLFAFTLLYQQCLISYIATREVSLASTTWTEGNELYYQLKELKQSNAGTKLSNIENSTRQSLQSASVLTGNIDVDAKLESGLAGRTLKIEVVQDVIVPFGMVAKFFNNGKPVQLRATAFSKIAEPTELIRNVDFSLEIVTTIAEWVGEKLEDIDFLGDCKTILKKLF